MFDFLKKVFGTKHDKDIQLLKPIVAEINEEFEKLNNLTDDELKAKTKYFRKIIKEQTESLELKKYEIEQRLINEVLETDEIADLQAELKKLDKEIFEVTNNTLNEILPEAFAVVKQVCKRLTDSGYTYSYTGHQSRWEMVPYDVQLMGGIVLHQGKISEMATGEGKTLVAVLPCYLNALPGKGVHLVTVNDYLAKRDSEWMKPVFDFLGITVGAIQSNMDNEQRKEIYNCDITYGTNNEFGFDYLRDNMVTDANEMVQRPHWYAIVDEVDSVLIDEARTPLIISGPVGQTEQKFDEMNPRVKRLVEYQTKLVNEIVSKANKLLESGKKEDLEEAGILLLRAHRGLPKHKKLMKTLTEPQYMKLMKDTELVFLRDNASRMPEIDEELYYVIDEKNHSIDIMDKGRNLLTSGQEDPNMFVIPDLGTEMSLIENDLSLTPEQRIQKTEQLYTLFTERSDRIHTINQLLRAYSLFEKDVEYIIQDGKVMIVDEHTGRVLEGRRYSEGLHQAIEAKEGVKVEKDTQTLATITLQNYFRLYHKLAGMTGTAETEAGEFQKIYNLDVVVIPTNKPIKRDDREDLIYRTKREKYNAIIADIENELKRGRAILVGTTSVEVSELLSKMLKARKIPHNVLNAKQHQKEAEIVQNAGKKGAVTIATNMAGRGTDIKLDHEVKKNGGLAIIGSERHESRRIDRQLRGRAGRQGDPGSSQFFISLEDNLMRLFGGERIASVMQRMKVPEGEAIQHSIITSSVERAQKKVEENNFGIRKRLIEYDNVMNMQRTVIYSRRKTAIRGERLRGELMDHLESLVMSWISGDVADMDYDEIKRTVRMNLLCDINITKEEFRKLSDTEIIDRIVKSAEDFYKKKEEMLGVEFMSNLERVALLQTIDEKWRDHLREMDDLKEGIHLRSYAQKDPLLEYKAEAFRLFESLIKEINKEFVIFSFKYFPQIVYRDSNNDEAIERQRRENLPKVKRNAPKRNVQYSHTSDVPDYLLAGSQAPPQPQAPDTGVKVTTFRKTEPTIGRNDPCPCGSGKKYKNCHGLMED